MGKKKLTKKQIQAIVIRTSERTLFTQCRQAWWWAYVERLKINEPQIPLEFGTMIHEALRRYYKPGIKRGPHPAKSFKKIYAAWVEEHGDDLYVRKDEDSPERVTAGELGDEMLCNYINLYGDDRNIEVICPEQLFQVEVRDDGDNLVCTYVGQIDAVVRDIRTGELGFLEHKTGAGLEPFGTPVELDEQSGSYWTFAPEFLKEHGLLGKDEVVKFVLFNRLKKAFADTRPKNEDGHALNAPTRAAMVAYMNEHDLPVERGDKNPDLMATIKASGFDPLMLGEVSTRQPGPLFKREYVYKTDHNRMVLFDRVVAQAKEMQACKDGALSVYKEPGKHCGWCPFFKTGMCQVHEDGGDWESIRDGQFTVWEPYAEHEILAEGRM